MLRRFVAALMGLCCPVEGHFPVHWKCLPGSQQNGKIQLGVNVAVFRRGICIQRKYFLNAGRAMQPYRLLVVAVRLLVGVCRNRKQGNENPEK